MLQEQTEATPVVMTSSRQALTSSASDDWGSPEVVRRFAACVLKPAALGPTSIDMDATSSAYWNAQWPSADRPREYLDGSAHRDVFRLEDWHAAIDRLMPGQRTGEGMIGSLFDNPPGDPSGGNVQEIFYTIARLHSQRKIGSAFWVGFSLEQLRSLIPHEVERKEDLMHPLDARACTVFPSSRIAYLAHPETMIRLYEKRLTKQADGSEHRRLTKAIDELRKRSDDSPVKGPAPTHSSYLTILWHWDAKIRRVQKAKAREFLRGQAELAKSVMRRAVAIGDIAP